ncbi:MAG: hypothetical protein Q4D38_11825, partial [Planctomycetia bacterium]|nr:hypothetical protein [Planctomycetia bacterium]
MSAEIITWNGTDGDWSSADNWLIGGAAAGRVPADGDIAELTAGAVAFPTGETFSGTVNLSGTATLGHSTTHWTALTSGALNVSGSALFDFKSNRLYLGSGAGNSHSTTVTNGEFRYAAGSTSEGENGGIYLGLNGGTARFTVSGAGVVNIGASGTDSYVRIGAGEGGNGTFTVTNGGKATFQTGSIYVGHASGTGALVFESGTVDFNLTERTLRIGSESGGTGTMEIKTGAVVTMTGNDVHVGYGAGAQGTITQTGGTFTVGAWLNIGENGTGTYNISGGTLDANGHLVVGRRGTGKMTISGSGVVDAQGVFVGYFPSLAGNSTLTVSGTGKLTGTTLVVGGNIHGHEDVGSSTNTSTVSVQGGTVSFTAESSIARAFTNSRAVVGVMDVSGGEVTFSSALNVAYGSGATGTMNVSGGTVNLKGHTRIGNDGGTGKLSIAGGNTTFTANLSVGHNGNSTGTLEIKDGANITLDCNDLYVGHNGTATGTVTQTGGTVSGRAWINIGEYGTGTYNISGGSLRTSQPLSVGRRGNGNMTVSGTAQVTVTNELVVGYFPKMSGDSTLTIDLATGGSVTANSLIIAKNADGGSNTPGTSLLLVKNGTLTVKGTGDSHIGQFAGATGKLEIQGGSVNFEGANTYVGNGSGAVAELLLKGGTLNASSGDFILANGGANVKMTVDGGTYNQNGKGNFRVFGSSTEYNNGKGTLIELKSGTIDALWLSIGQGGTSGGLSTVDMTGGELKVGNNLRVGFDVTKANFNASGGNVTVGGTLVLAEYAQGDGSQLNIIGSGSTWSAGTINLTSYGVVNLTAGALGSGGDAPVAAVSTLVSRGNATVNSAVNVDMAGYVYSGVAFISDTRQTLVDAVGTLSWNPSSVEITGPWLLDTSVTGEVALVIDDDQVAGATAGGYAYGDLGESGWLKITG